ncbi:MAG: hypothetical protein IT305_28645 [Chloroflexi bacterium]|nr:hypothetical protein [Chloroflexota bacterium]
MLFFFELFFFVLTMLTLALGEFVSRGLALGLWLTATALVSIGYLLARRPIQALADGAPASGSANVDERWARTFLYNWRRTNALLVVGAVVVSGWYWLGQL